jgi:Ca2+-transporting ATPase
MNPTDLRCPPQHCAALNTQDVFSRLDSRAEGLSDREVIERHERYGKNRLPSPKTIGALERISHQLTSPLILILILIAVIVPLIGHATDSIVILVVLVFNTVLGFIQEGRATRALEALKQHHETTCTVRRNGKEHTIPADELVPGDIVLLQEGDRIPADGRVIECSGLSANESMLTGESVPVEKTAQPIQTVNEHSPLGDIANAVWSQSLITNGHGAFIVSSIGRETEIGRIAAQLSNAQTEPPLAAKVRNLSRTIALTVAGFSVFLLFIGTLAGRPFLELLATVMSLAVSIIPEGLPIVLTLVLARGVIHMAKRHAVVKKLNAVEGLGQVQVICTDKTGTLTENQLVVSHAWAEGHTFRVKGHGYQREGSVLFGIHETTTAQMPELKRLAEATEILGAGSIRTENNEEIANGDPVNAALLTFARRAQIQEDGWKIIDEEPFSYALRRRSVRVERGSERRSVMAGSPESVLAMCTGSEKTEAVVEEFAKEGLRVIAIAERSGDLELDREGSWKLVGFVGMGDPIRENVMESIAWCQNQNIRVVMVTGDHPQTAFAIGKSIGIAQDLKEVMNGPDMESMDDAALDASLDRIRIFSRISPSHKVRIVEAYRRQGFLTAMTGDGVNDAPALHRADIGIAMGKGGTEVAREAAHLVLMDDNFATIIAAIQEGRATVSNVRRVISYLFSTSVGEAGVIVLALFLNLPLPLLPVQIIWINLITDSFLDVSLGMEPRHGSSQDRSGSLLDRRAAVRILFLGGVMALGTFLVYLNALGNSAVYIQTMTLTTLAAFQWMNAWNARSEHRSLATLPFFSNKPLLLATATVVGLHLLALYAPPFQRILQTTALSGRDWIFLLAVASTVILADEIWKKLPHKTSKPIALLSH